MPNDDMLGVCQLCGITFPHIHHDDTKPKEFEMIMTGKKERELPQEFIPWPNAYAVIQRKYEKGDDSIMVNPHTCALAIFVNLGTAKILLDVLRQKTENTIEYAIVEVIIEPSILPIKPLPL